MEPSTPANMIAALRSNRARQSLQKAREDDRKTTMNKVKQLYLDRRYKQCAALCEQTLKNEATKLHPLHNTFLQFFTAICYESLGQAAHQYSSNKLPFLNLAHQAFASAQNALPLPYSTDENGNYDTPAISPTLTDFGPRTSDEANQTVPSTPTFQSPTPTSFFAVRARSSTPSSNISEDDTQTISHSVPNFEDYSPRQPMQDIKSLSWTDEFAYIDGEPNTELRLSLKLDTPERQSDLAPKPLFIKKKSSVTNPPAPLRPLPPIQPRCDLLTGHRQTALHVPPLVSRYDSLSTPHDKSTDPNLAYATATSSLHLVRYNANLASFRSQLSTHISTVSDAITKTSRLQNEHKAKHSKRLASYWMLKPADEGLGDVERKAAEKKERIERLRQNGWRVNKERFGWKGEEYYWELRRRVEVELRGSE